MSKRINAWLVGLPLCFTLAMNSHGNETSVVTLTVNPENCPELIELTNDVAEGHRQMGLKAAEQVSAGGTLEEESCLSDLRNFDFDFWSGFSSIKGVAIKALTKEAQNQLRNMACDAAEAVYEAGQKYLTCSASFGVRLNIGAGFVDLDVSECLGVGMIDYDYDAGRYDAGGSTYTLPVDDNFDTSVDIIQPRNNSPSQSNSNNSSWSGWLR